MIEDILNAILDETSKNASQEGLFFASRDGLELVRANAPTGYVRTLYKPLICLVIQGAKQVMFGEEQLTFTAGQSFIVSADIPVTGRVVSASPARPYAALALELDLTIMREVMAQMAAHSAVEPAPKTRLFVEQTEAAVLDCARRLVQVLDRPDAFAVLRPAIAREMHYWLLAGRHGGAMRQLAMPDGHFQRIARAVSVLRADFARQIPVERLAAAAGMSTSSFHQHFKSVTSLSPLQFQKHLRLLEARRLLLTEGCTASHAAFEVGYESVSQFTREYTRMFGAPPRRDRDAVRAAA